MAITLPQHRAAVAQVQQSTFTIETFFERLVDAVNARYDGTRSKAIYLAYGLKLKQEKSSVLAALKNNFDTVVKNSLENGYNLLSHTSLGNLSDDSIITSINLDESEEHVDDWINAHFTSTISSINSLMADINSKIPDTLKSKIKQIDDEFNKVLSEYAIDSSTLDPSSPLGIKIIEFKKNIESEFRTYVGTPFDKYFYEKNSFPISSRINTELAKKEFTDAIAPTVKQLIETEVSALSQRPNPDSRTYAEDSYNFFVHGIQLSWSDFNKKYMSGIEAIVNKYTSSGKIIISPPSTHVTKGTDLFNVKLETHFDVSIGLSNFNINLNTIILRKHEYALEILASTARSAFDASGPVSSFPHTTGFRTKIRDSISWTDGQELTEKEILDNLAAGGGVDKWNTFFSRVKLFQGTLDGSNTEVKYFFVNGEIHIKYIDNKIAPSDFDFGDVTPIDKEEKKQYWFNRHESVEYGARYVGIPQSPLFNNHHIYNFKIGIDLVSRIDEFAAMLETGTSSAKQQDAISSKNLLNSDGTYKDIDKSDLIKIFPTLQANFFDEFEKESTYSIIYKLKEVSKESHGESVIEATIKSPTLEKKVEIIVKTYNEDMILSTTAEKLKAFENTWEDKTPSISPSSFGNSAPESFVAGTVPSKGSLDYIFKGIDQLFIKMQLTSPAREVELLQIRPSTEGIKESLLTSEMLESWNKDLIDELGGMTQEMRNTISLLLAGSSIFGKSRESKYLYANIEMALPSSKTYQLIAVHYLSEEQRFIEYNLIEQSMSLFVTSYLQKIFKEHKVPESIKQEVLKKFNEMSTPLLAQIKTILDPDNPSAEVPDFMLHRIQNIIQDLKMNLKDIKDTYNLNEEDLQKLKTASRVFKYVLASVGGIIGLSAIMALLIPIRTALGNRKLKKENPQAKRSSKKMIVVSAISGLLAAGSSVAIMIYVFLTQGGL